ncbi:hypothetical protein ACI5KX_10245 [Erythrobacter sp. GH1-10]|uniref:hypothetical protein n=1 Tax=Erythrobacter sp. GH1-10 TaxID=3349334 RepID=UPI00387839D8
MASEQSVATEELEMARQLIERGRQAAALDGNHLILWGCVCSLALSFQYLAEVYDWAASSLLWLWQPLLIACFLVSIFVERSGAGRRLGNPVSRAYVSVFCAAGILIGSFLVVNGLGSRPEPQTAAILVPSLLASAFLVLSCVTDMRWMMLPALGWWAIMVLFAANDQLVPTDFLVLSLSSFLFLAVPGMALKWIGRS